MVYAFSMEEPGGAARVMKDYSKDNDKLVVKLVAFGGQLLDQVIVYQLSRPGDHFINLVQPRSAEKYIQVSRSPVWLIHSAPAEGDAVVAFYDEFIFSVFRFAACEYYCVSKGIGLILASA